MSVVIKVPAPSQAVREYQKINAIATRRLSETDNDKTITFWLDRLQQRANEISKEYNISVKQLFDDWEKWCASVYAAREKHAQSVKEEQ